MNMRPIEPTKITCFDRTDAELELFWIFCLCVAGKNADTQAGIVNRLFSNCAPNESPFDYLRKNKNALHNILVAHRVGQYTRITKAILGSLDVDLRTATVWQLMSIYGVGNKTSRFFVLHSRRDAEHAVLDTHILRWMRRRFGCDVPDNTPQCDAVYQAIEKQAVYLMRKSYRGMSLADIDLLIWTQMSGRLEELSGPKLTPQAYEACFAQGDSISKL